MIAVAGEARCPQTDLLPSGCAHCRHIPDLFPTVPARIVESGSQ